MGGHKYFVSAISKNPLGVVCMQEEFTQKGQLCQLPHFLL